MSQTISASPVTIGKANWQNNAACKGLDSDIFHPDMTDPYYDQRVAEAKAICAQCGVKKECRLYRKAHQIKTGIWGGISEDHRSKKTPPILAARRLTCQILNEVYTQKGSMPNRDDLAVAAKQFPLVGKKAIRRNFGSLAVAKEVSGLNARAEADRMMHCIISLAALRRELGRDVTSDDVRRESKRNKEFPGLETIRYNLGIHDAFRRAGNSVARSAPRRSREQLLDEFIQLCKDEGRVLEPCDIKRLSADGECAYWSTYYRHFGSYEELKAEVHAHLTDTSDK